MLEGLGVNGIRIRVLGSGLRARVFAYTFCVVFIALGFRSGESLWSELIGGPCLGTPTSGALRRFG